MDFAKIKLAAANNARWCDAVCHAHGRTTEFTSKLWRCHGSPPRFYPGAVSLERGTEQEVRQLRPSAFKDSFNDVELTDAGYSVALVGSWIHRECQPVTLPALDWGAVRSELELTKWERAWRGADESANNSPRQFPVSLLRDSNLVFLGRYEHARIFSGGVLCVTDSVVGLSNCFYPEGDGERTMSDLFGESVRRFPARAVVGWESGKALEAAVAAGFSGVGALRVWVTG